MIFYAFGILIVLALCAAVAALVGGVAFYFTRKRSKAVRFATLALVPLTFVVLISRFLGPQELTDEASLRQVWQDEFGSPPPAGLHDLRASRHIAGDSGQTWLKFTAPKDVVDSLSVAFSLSTKNEFHRISANPNEPSWWHPAPEASLVYYTSDRWKPALSLSEAAMAYDPEKQEVYFTQQFID